MYCLPLAQGTDPSQAGGKAANLAQAIRLGFPVPEGFVLLRSALHAFLESNGFLPVVQATLSAYAGAPWREQLQRFERLRAVAVALTVPGQVRSPAEELAALPAGCAVEIDGQAGTLTVL